MKGLKVHSVGLQSKFYKFSFLKIYFTYYLSIYWKTLFYFLYEKYFRSISFLSNVLCEHNRAIPWSGCSFSNVSIFLFIVYLNHDYMYGNKKWFNAERFRRGFPWNVLTMIITMIKHCRYTLKTRAFNRCKL